MTARPIGSIIAAVAVLEIQSDTKAVAARKPNRSRGGRVPTVAITPRATRR